MATQPAPLSVSEQLERIAADVHDMAFDYLEPARSIRDAEGRIARIEDIANRLRAAVRGQPVVMFAQSGGQIAEVFCQRNDR